MTTSDTAFVGDIPRNYEKYLGPLIFSQYAKDLANRITLPPGTTLLETAAGTGMATRQLRDTIAQDVRIVATDLSLDMLNIAKGKFSDKDNINFQTANATKLPFEDASFAAIVCQFSMMFFPDKLRSLQEAARVLKPGGKFYFNVWDSFEHNHLVRAVNHTLCQSQLGNPVDFFKIPYGFHQIDVIKNLLFCAGFTDIEISVLPKTSSAPTARDVAIGFIMGTPARQQIEQTSPDSLAKIVDEVEQAIGKEFGDKSIQAKMQAMVFTAHYPG